MVQEKSFFFAQIKTSIPNNQDLLKSKTWIQNRPFLNTYWYIRTFLEVRFAVRGGGRGSNLHTHCLKLVRIMLETWNSARKYRHICSFKNIAFSTKTPLLLLMSAIFAKNQYFLAKIVVLLKAIVRELYYVFFSSVFRFSKIKGYY